MQLFITTVTQFQISAVQKLDIKLNIIYLFLHFRQKCNNNTWVNAVERQNQQIKLFLLIHSSCSSASLYKSVSCNLSQHNLIKSLTNLLAGLQDAYWLKQNPIKLNNLKH